MEIDLKKFKELQIKSMHIFSLEKDDILLITPDSLLSIDQIDRIYNLIKKTIGNVKTLVLPKQLSLSVLRKKKGKIND